MAFNKNGVTSFPFMCKRLASCKASKICTSIASCSISNSFGIGLAINTEPLRPKSHLDCKSEAISWGVSIRKGDWNPLLEE